MGRIVRRCTVKLLREPIVHFLVIGAVIFGLYEVRNNKAAPEPDNRITVTAGDVERLNAAWAKQWQRPPTADELKGVVDEHVREEILYREALALGLDRDDTIIRRRLDLGQGQPRRQPGQAARNAPVRVCAFRVEAGPWT